MKRNLGAAALVVAVVALIGVYLSAYLGSDRWESATVTKTERVTYGSGDGQSHKYLVYTDRGTYECTDAMLFGKFNSSDVYGSIRADRSYRFHVVWYRVPFFSMYPNIVEASPE